MDTHDYRPCMVCMLTKPFASEGAKCHSPGWSEVKPRVNVKLSTIRTLKVCNKNTKLIESDSPGLLPHSAKTLHAMHVMQEKSIEG